MSADEDHDSGPSLSILMCVNRRNPFLATAIASMLGQTQRDFEFLIVANACGDDLVEDLHRLTGGDPRVQILRTAIGQLAFNLNLLADRARGEYLVRMDADDISAPERIERLQRSLAERPADVLGSWTKLIDEEGRQIGEFRPPLEHEEIVRRLPLATVFCHPSVAVRRSFLLALRGYLGGFASEDSDLWIRGLSHGAVYRNLPEFLLSYRVHDESSSRSRQSYAEMAGHWLRELLVAPRWYALKGFAVALGKCLLSPTLKAWHKRKFSRT